MITCENIYKFRDYLTEINTQSKIHDLLRSNYESLKKYLVQEDYSADRKLAVIIKDKKDTDFVIQNTLKNIKSYYLDNYYQCNVPVEEAEDFANYLSNPNLYVDVYTIGNTIEFQL